MEDIENFRGRGTLKGLIEISEDFDDEIELDYLLDEDNKTLSKEWLETIKNDPDKYKLVKLEDCKEHDITYNK